MDEVCNSAAASCISDTDNSWICPAFRSRIHVSLLYEPLSWDQTRAIWTDHLHRLKTEKRVETNEDGILRYAQTLFNEQKCEHDNAWKPPVGKASLTGAHFQIVADASVQFDDYMKKTLDNKTQPQYALAEQWRDDTYKGATSFVLMSVSQMPGSMSGHAAQPSYAPMHYQPVNPMRYSQGFLNAATTFAAYGQPEMTIVNLAIGMQAP
jgi:hypothetical protein